jgi:hypothetical protein
MYSIDPARLNGVGIAFTLTLRETPEVTEWNSLKKNLLQNIARYAVNAQTTDELLRWLTITEFQARKAPHIHGAIYVSPRALFTEMQGVVAYEIGDKLTSDWVRLAEPFGTSIKAQDFKLIEGVEGWLEYLSKHVGRGTGHYQRAGLPPGWASAPKLWSKGGRWPENAAIELPLSTLGRFHTFRRLAIRWLRADASRKGQAKRAAMYKRRLKKIKPEHSRFVGISDWMPHQVTLDLYDFAESSEPFGDCVKPVLGFAHERI